MLEVAAVGAVDVGPITQSVHLVNLDAGKEMGTLFECVEQGHRLSVGDRDDDIGTNRQILGQLLGQVVDRYGCAAITGDYMSLLDMVSDEALFIICP